MTDVLKVLTNIRSLRVIARDLALEQLESILEKFSWLWLRKKKSY
ncbi:global DNA-binding transcriptional dual regulator H-NS [Aggregatibacter aphrophilus]|uniref:Global DNA-binding transcriptional dual regulator H-NS n=1 Tax=Aggregatibacter aphrophilus TaxID=732 RepID=A0A336N505_AGGAP|nr:global DNA-binding transcriptional dual regulator H-NS [Aggregatibacter aphrophilus]